MSNEDSRPKIGRRNLLKTGSALALGVSVAPSVVSAKQDSLIELTGNENNPVTEAEILKNIKQLKKSHDTVPKSATVFPDPGPNQYTASYVLKIGSDGVPLSFVGYAQRDGEDHAASVQNMGEEYRTEMENATSSQDYEPGRDSSTSDFTIQQTTVTRGDNWNTKGRPTAVAEGDNGTCKIDGTLCLYDESEDYKENMELWGGDWNYISIAKKIPLIQPQVDKLVSQQRWTDAVASSPTDLGITLTAPPNDINGTYSSIVGIGFNGEGAAAEYGWTYSQPNVSMDNQSDSSIHNAEDIAQWEYTPNDVTDRLEVRTGSRCWFDNINASDSECSQYSANSIIGTIRNKSHFNSFGGNEITATGSMVIELC
jgi:hypothetical protein